MAMNHDYVSALAGGAIIGAAASVFLLANGRVAGISGLFGALLRARTEARATRAAFIAGLLLAGLVIRVVAPGAFASAWSPSLPVALAAGALVGFGTQLGGGCTSGHGVCGLSRLSVRSLVATLTFIAFGVVTVLVVRR